MSERGVAGWREATQAALYGPAGFYRREQPAAHFRTSVHASAGFAAAVARLAGRVGAGEIVDVGAGGGEFLTHLQIASPGLRLHGVDVAARPPVLAAGTGWSAELPPPGASPRLLIANEWLDNVPLDVAEVGGDGAARLVLVDPATGAERLGEAVTGADAAWLARWWPLAGAEPGTRAEIGWPRDEAWAAAIRSLGAGVAVAIDYAHDASCRPPFGTLAGYRAGRVAAAVPDGSCDITAHVALDACAAAGSAAGATSTVSTTQRAALAALGVDGTRPTASSARADPAGYLAALAAASEAAELRDPAGLGAFTWLIQAVGMDLPGLGSALRVSAQARRGAGRGTH